jgi:hypothetical protein
MAGLSSSAAPEEKVVKAVLMGAVAALALVGAAGADRRKVVERATWRRSRE